MDVYESGPLRGRPRRGPREQTIISPPIGDAMPTPGGKSSLPPEVRRMFGDWTYSGDPSLIDELEVPGLPADARENPQPIPAEAHGPDIDWRPGRPFRSARLTMIGLLILAAIAAFGSLLDKAPA